MQVTGKTGCTCVSINRIRLEFKEDWKALTSTIYYSINRIRLEFKVDRILHFKSFLTVLIESDWNLKYSERTKRFENSPVLIESDWNLKKNNRIPPFVQHRVLIESDWNLKHSEQYTSPDSGFLY